jgi:phosphoenolpyruvate carboxykinase (ATP)
MVRAALNGTLKDAPTFTDPVFGLKVPSEVPGVPSEVLNPQATWQNKDEYLVQAKGLAQRFEKNYNDIRGVLAEPKADAVKA